VKAGHAIRHGLSLSTRCTNRRSAHCSIFLTLPVATFLSERAQSSVHVACNAQRQASHVLGLHTFTSMAISTTSRHLALRHNSWLENLQGCSVFALHVRATALLSCLLLYPIVTHKYCCYCPGAFCRLDFRRAGSACHGHMAQLQRHSSCSTMQRYQSIT
jgi:hypothetical protein